MSELAPGRTYDMARLLGARDSNAKYSNNWNHFQVKIDDLVEEGKCPLVRKQREVLLKASIANDNEYVEKSSRIIEEHVQRKHPKRFYRAWAK